MMQFLQKKKATSMLGLALDGDRLEVALVRRTNGSVEVQKTLTVALSLDLFKNEPELVGREIRNHLDAAGIRERRCVVGVPLGWVLALHVKTPDLPEADIDDYLQIEAERGFPSGYETLQISNARHQTPGGETYAALVAVPKESIARLEQVLAAAQLKPVSFSLGITALPGPAEKSSQGALMLAVGENTVDLQIASGGGVAALRALEAAFESEGAEKRLLSDFIARELRITLGQLPTDVRESIREVRVFGQGRFAQQLAGDIRPAGLALGLKIEPVTKYAGAEFGLQLPAGTAVSVPLSLALRQLSGQGGGFEFLPPKVSVWEQFTSRYSSKKLAYASAAAGFAVLVLASMFAWQQWQLSTLGSRWDSMKSRVSELEGVQQQIKKFRPWHDERLTGLNILKKITESFPEDGAVTAKTLEIRNLSAVTCSGTARDNAALLKTMEQLRKVKEINDVKLDSLRGKSPMQFTINFRWSEGGTREN